MQSQQREVLGQVSQIRVQSEEADQRIGRLITSVEWIAATLDRVSSSQRMHEDRLSSLGKPLETINRQLTELSAVALELPSTLEAHGQAVRTAANASKASAETNERMAQAVQSCGEAVQSLRDSWNEAIRFLRHADTAREQALRQQLDRHWRRISIVCAASFLLTSAAVTAIVLGARLLA